jgi:peptide/nickel transport system substrate-binding protein
VRNKRQLVVVTLALLGILGSSACSTARTATRDTLVLAYGTEPTLLDGARTADVSSSRVGAQIFETLVRHEPGGLGLEPGLARSWRPSDDAATWTFALQHDVRFHDGTAFDAAAVCANFDRWYHSTGVLQTAPLSPSWRRTFEGFAQKDVSDVPEASLFRSCEATAPDEAVVRLAKPLPLLPTALTGWGFSIASPDALVRYEADKVDAGPPPKFQGTFGTEHPVGTGPFRFESWVRGDRLVLVRNDDYWGDKAKLRRLIFRAIADGATRRQALEAGEIDQFEPVDPADAAALEAGGAQILERRAMNVAFLGFNQAIEPFSNPKVRQAIAHAINRQAVVDAKFPKGTLLARQLQPPEVWGGADDVATYGYDPELARRLLAESGVADPTIEFWYPTNIAVPDNPDPQGTFEAYKADLERIGFTVVAHPAPSQPDYSQGVAAGKAGMFFGARYGDDDPDYFFGPAFRQRPLSFGFDDPELFALVSRARYEPDHDRRVQLYQDINRRLMATLPAVPLVHVRPQLVVAAGVKGYVPGPIGPSESLAGVTVES